MACSAIVAAALAVMAATAVIATAGRAKPPVSSPDVPVAAGVGRSLLYQEEINSILGVKDVVLVSWFGRLGHDDAKVDPAECAAVNYAQSAEVWDAVDWEAMEGMYLESPGADNYRNVTQAVVGLSSPEEAQKMMTKSSQAWKACLGKAYAVTFDGQEPLRWVMRDFNSKGDTITALTLLEGTRTSCQLVRTRLKKYVIDAQMCGPDVTNQAEEIAARIVDRLKEKSAS